MRRLGNVLLMGAGVVALALFGCASTTESAEPVAMSQAEKVKTMEDMQREVQSQEQPRANVTEAAWRVREPEDRSLIEGDTVRMTVHGMSCPKCANNIERQVARIVGVSTIDIDMGQGHVLVGLRPAAKPSPRDLARAIDNTGFTLVEIAER